MEIANKSRNMYEGLTQSSINNNNTNNDPSTKSQFKNKNTTFESFNK